MVGQVGTKDMTVGNTKKIIINFAIPIFLSQLFQQLYNMADTLIVGKYLGTEALAAVSSSGPLIFLLVSFFNGAAMGAGVVISRYYGAGDYKKVSKAVHTNFAVGLISSTILTIFGCFIFFNIAISLNAVLGIPSVSTSILIFFIANASFVSFFITLYTVPYVPFPNRSVAMYPLPNANTLSQRGFFSFLSFVGVSGTTALR